MKKLNVKLLIWAAALSVLLGLGVFILHHFQTGRIARALLWQAQHAEEDGRLDLAARFLGRYLELEPGNNEERAHLGRILADEKLAASPRGRQRALFVLEQVVTREPDRADCRLLLVRMALGLRRYANALEHLQVLHKEAPKDGEVLDLLGQAHQALGQFDLAKDSFQRAMAASPQMIDAYERLAALLRAHPDPKGEKARDPDAIMDRLVANNPQMVEARLARWSYFADTGLLTRVGNLLTSNKIHEPIDPAKLDAATRGRLEKADQDITKALALAPDNPDVLLAAAELRPLQGQREAALQALTRGQLLHPQDPRFYRLRASLELQQDQPDQALSCLREGIKTITGRSQGELRWTLANLLLDQNRTEEASKELARLEKGGYAPAALDYLKGRMLVAEGKWAQAAPLFERCRAALESGSATDRDGEAFLAHTNLYLGRCYERLNDPGRQMAAFGRLAQRNPASAAARLSLATAHAAAGRLEEALDQYRQALALPDVPPRASIDFARLLILRNLQREQRDWAAVQDALDRAEKMQPKAPEIVLLRAEVQVAQSRLPEARQLIEEARAKDPKQIEFHTALAGLYIRQGQPEKAGTILQEAEKQAGDSVELRLARIWYWINERETGHHESRSAALADLVRDLDKFPPDGRLRLLEEVSIASNRLGDSKQALTLWEQLARQPQCANDLRIQFGLVELALQVEEDSLVRRGLEQIQRIEGSQGTLWLLGESLRLIRRVGDVAALTQARAHLDAAARMRPGWIALHVARAELEEKAGRPEQAFNELREAINLGERSPRVVRRTVELLNSRGRYLEAAQVIRQLKRQAPLSDDLRRLEVDVSLHNRDVSNAIQHALELVNPDSNDYRDLLWLGQKLAESGQRLEQAERFLRRATELGAERPETWVVLVEFLASQQRTEQAEAEIAKAQAKLPKEQADLALGQCYEAIGQSAQARKHYEAAYTARPQDAAVVYALAGFCLRGGRFPEAERCLRLLYDRKVPATNDEIAWARRNLAWVRAATGGRQGLLEGLSLVGLKLDSTGKVLPPEREKPTVEARKEQQARVRVLAVHNRPSFRRLAIAILEELNREEPLRGDDLYLLAQLHETDGNWPRARQDFRDLLTMQADTPEFLAHYIQTLLKHNDLEEARSCLERLEKSEQARKLPAGSLGVVRLRAAYLEARGDKDQALELLRASATKKDARPDEVLLYIGYLADRKRLDEALNECERAWKMCAPEAAARASIATLHAGKPTEEQISRVERWLLAAQEKTPNATPILLYLAELRDLQKRYADAEDLYRQVLTRERTNATALNNLAWLLAQKKDGAAEALELINRAIDLQGPAPGLLDTRANVYLAGDQAEAAIKDLEEAAAEAPGAPRLFQLARARLKAKDRTAAAKAFAEAKRLGFDPKQLHPLQQELAQSLSRELESR
jgi:tetratricopeptide (TPR) repeat protein